MPTEQELAKVIGTLAASVQQLFEEYKRLRSRLDETQEAMATLIANLVEAQVLEVDHAKLVELWREERAKMECEA